MIKEKEKVSFYKETNFKDTEIGKIPEDWEVVRLGNYIKEFVRGVSYKQSEVSNEKKQSSIALIRATNLQRDKIILDDLIFIPEEKVKRNQLVKKGDVIITTSSGSKNLVGRAISVKENIQEPITIGAFLAIIRNKPDINKDFFFLIFKSSFYRKHLNNLSAGTNINNLKKSFILNLKLPLPPLKEQKAIAKVLKDFDDLLEVIDKQIEKLEKIKKGLMNVYFTKGIFKHEKFKDTEIGRLPADWEVVKLGEIAELISGFSFKKSFQGKKNAKYPFIKVNDLNYASKYINKADNYISYEDKKVMKVKIYDPPFIIFPKVGMCVNLNKYRIVKVQSTFDNNLIGIYVKDNTNIEFLFYYLNQNVKLSKLSGMTTVPSIRKSALENLKIPLPPLEEQKAIAEKLKNIDDLIETKQKEKEHLERAKKKVMDLLLTGKVRVREEA